MTLRVAPARAEGRFPSAPPQHLFATAQQEPNGHALHRHPNTSSRRPSSKSKGEARHRHPNTSSRRPSTNGIARCVSAIAQHLFASAQLQVEERGPSAPPQHLFATAQQERNCDTLHRHPNATSRRPRPSRMAIPFTACTTPIRVGQPSSLGTSPRIVETTRTQSKV